MMCVVNAQSEFSNCLNKSKVARYGGEYSLMNGLHSDISARQQLAKIHRDSIMALHYHESGFIQRSELNQSFISNGTSLCDSIITYYFLNETDSTYSRKEVFSYDVSGNTILTMTYYWSEDLHIWENGYKRICEYDEWGNRVIYERYSWDDYLNVWVGQYKFEESYHANGDLSLYKDYYWGNMQEKWICDHQDIWEYNENGDEIMWTCQREWSVDQNDWLEGQKQVIEYYDHNKIDEIIEYDWEAGWELNEKQSYFYNEDNRLETFMSYKWTDVGQWEEELKFESKYNDEEQLYMVLGFVAEEGEWINLQKQLFEFDGENNVLLHETYLWEESIDDYKPEFKYEMAYDTYGNRVLWVDYWWSEEHSSWVGTWKRGSVYDSAGNRLESFRCIWSDDLFDWVNYYLYEYLFDQAGNCILEQYNGDWSVEDVEWTSRYKDYYQFDSDNNVIHSQYWDWSSYQGTWNLHSKSYYYYSPMRFDEYLVKELPIYPNPATNWIQLGKEKIEGSVHFYNMRGQLVKEVYIDGNKVEISDLISGVYIVRIVEGQLQSVGQFIKE